MKKDTSLSARLFLDTLAILLLGIGLSSLLTWAAVETLYIDTQRENLLAQANLTATALRGQNLPASEAQPYLQTTNAQPGIHTRLLSEQGAVLVSLPIQSGDILAPPAENSNPIPAQELSARPEIALAMRGQPATAMRTVFNRRVLYAASPVLGETGGITALVYLAMPLPAGGLPVNLLLELAGAALVALILALIATTLLSHRITGPIGEISRAAAAVSAGNLDQHVLSGSPIRELNSLGQGFNDMTESLRRSDQTKNAFVANVTHELRTPLTVIKGTIETLQDGALDDIPGRGPLLNSMQRETDRLIRMVNELLLLTRADAGLLNMKLQPLDLASLARERCAQLSTVAGRRQVHLTVTGADPAGVIGDFDRLSQVLDNLLDNAIRYSPAGATVTVEIHKSESAIQCEVRDCGAGISMKHLPFIFDRFYRVDASRQPEAGGAGLGLAIAKALVLAQGGNISAESVEGTGTTIRFWLPNVPQLTIN